MKSSAPAGRGARSVSSALGLGEKVFSTAEERQFASAVEAGLEQVESGLLAAMSFADNLADVTSRYLLDAGGKRVRPTLALLTAQLGKGNSDDVIVAAQAIEIIHLASLYHDDVMDEAQMRRGVPSAQSVWGNSVAILTGDLLFARASKLVAGLGETVIRLQADTFERLCLGQLHETIGPKDDQDPIAHYLDVLADKTGSLIAAAAQIGVILSGAPAGYRAAVTIFGEKVGVAFQLVDDVIDLAPPVDETGKNPGTDLRTRIERDVNIAQYGEADEVELTAAIAELRAHAVTQQTIDEAHRWAREAVEALAPLPAGPVKKALTRFADSIVERSS